MKNSVCASLSSTLFSVLLSAVLVAGCSNDNKSVALRDGTATPAPGEQTKPSNPGEKPGSSPVPLPSPGDVTNPGAPGTQPTPTPTPAPVTTRVARFMCEGAMSKSFNTLRSDAVANFQMPILSPAVGNFPMNWVSSAVPLQSDGNTVFFVMQGQEQLGSPLKIYRATGNLLSGVANVQVLSSFAGVPAQGGFPYENLKLSRRVLSANWKRTAYLYPATDGTYTWESLKGSKFTVPFNANDSFNPEFIGGDDYLRFEQERQGYGTVTQKFFNFVTKKTFSLPDPLDDKDSQLFGYIDSSKKNLYWVEGRLDGTWKIRMTSVSSPTKGVTVGTLSGTSVHLPMTFVDRGSETVLTYVEEQFATDDRNRLFLKSGAIHVVKVSASQVKITSEKTVPYSEEIKNGSLNPTVLAGGVLNGLFVDPISGRVFSTFSAVGGLVSFDLNSYSWRTHGAISGSACYNPAWGIEVTNE